jgi:hypothetical protein
MIRWLLYIILAIAGLFAVFRALSILARRRNRLSAREVANTIERHIDGTEGKWDWDYFTSIPLADEHLNAIVRRCADLDMLLPEHRNPQLRKIVEQLRKEPDA